MNGLGKLGVNLLVAVVPVIISFIMENNKK